MLTDLLHRLRGLFRRRQAERELDDELRFHLEQEQAKLRVRGLTAEQAYRQSRLALGGPEQIKEQVRAAWGTRWLDEAAQDLRHALRSLRRTPAFTASAVLTLALGLGVNTVVFQVVHTVLLAELPYRTPEQLVHIAETHPQFPLYQVAAPDFFDWQRSAQSFSGLAAHTFQEMNKWVILGDGEPEPVQIVQASASLFPLLGVAPIAGRFYTAAEEQQKASVVVLSESLWRRKYHADPALIGRQIRLVGWAVTVVGVVAQSEAQPRWGEVWMPLSHLDVALTETRRFHTLEVIGRLKPGVAVAAADAEMHALARRLAQQHPETNSSVGATVRPLSLWLTGQVRPALLMAWASVSLVLLLACANVAHLVLVRTVHRARELALRSALGAGMARQVRFLLAESSVAAAAGALGGLLLSRLLLPWLLAREGGDLPRLTSPALQVASFGFASAATLLCAMLCVLPAVWYARKLDMRQTIQQSGGLSLTHRRSRLMPTILAMEVALAFVVLSGAGLLCRSYAALLAEPLGFDPGPVLAFEKSLALDWAASARTFDQRVAPRLRVIPGVLDVAAANMLPMTLSATEASRFTTRFRIPSRTSETASDPLAQLRWTTPAYFGVLGIPLLQGRLFTAADTGRPVCLINLALARRYFPGQSPVGRSLIRNVGAPEPQAVTILGVVGDVRDLALDVEPGPAIYELNVSNRVAVVIRTAVEPGSLVPAVREALRGINPDSPLRVLAPLPDLIAISLARRRFALELLVTLALLAALLTAVGVYGLVSYTLSQRRHEFAIRRALGAPSTRLLALLLQRFALPLLAGLGLGGILMTFFTSALRTQLYKLSPADPWTLAGVIVSLPVLVIAAALRPLLLATRISASLIRRE